MSVAIVKWDGIRMSCLWRAVLQQGQQGATSCGLGKKLLYKISISVAEILDQLIALKKSILVHSPLLSYRDPGSTRIYRR
jgi:hypothetical protein